ncbi:hypothetical protein PTKIN_Ptkin14bG0011100 [Pterospermum kingtungense]
MQQGLPQLTHLLKEDYILSGAFPKVRTLAVLDCCKLKNLVRSWVSFEDLTSLEVSGCHGFVNLLSCSTAKSLVQLTRMSITECSTAKSLVQLTRMSITDCDMIEEIIGGDPGEEVKGCIVFSQLKYLQLSCLPSLSSPGESDCERMPKDVRTPKLQQVILTEDEENGRRDAAIGRRQGNSVFPFVRLKIDGKKIFYCPNLEFCLWLFPSFVSNGLSSKRKSVEDVLADVKLWCERVDKTIAEEVKKVKDLQDKAKANCFIGLCATIKFRYHLSRNAEEDVVAVDQLLLQGQFNKVAFCDVPPAPVSAAPKNFKAFYLRKKVFEEIMKALADSIMSMIGVYGAGGVGKTTLVNEVVSQVKEVELFGLVVKAKVTQYPNIEKIQDQIAESFGLTLLEKSIEVRAHWLSESLKKEKKILSVLDDIWAGLDLKEVGIPFGDQHNGCKILLTSRN